MELNNKIVIYQTADGQKHKWQNCFKQTGLPF